MARRKELLGRSRSRWKDDIKVDIREIRWGSRAGFMWLRIGPVASFRKHDKVDLGSVNCLEIF
jgi:hypothetical protein